MAGKRPSLSLCMIVKDEEEDLPRALASAAGLADEMVVVDTGSQDKSKYIAGSYGARVYEYPWQGDFSGPKNLALDKARGKWILFLDADEELPAKDKEKIRELLAEPGTAEGFLFTMVNFTGERPGGQYELNLNLKLFRNRPIYRYSRPLHEQIEKLGPGPELVSRPDIRVLHYGYLDSHLARKGKKERNLRILENHISSGNPDAYDLFNLGVEYLRLNRFREALECFALARRGQTGNPLWLSACARNLLQCLLQLGLWDEAIEEAGRAVELYPDYVDLVYLKGVALAGRGMYPQALGAFYQAAAMDSQALSAYSHDPGLSGYKAYYSIGQIHLQLGQYEEAGEALHKSLTLAPGYRPALITLCRTLAKQGDKSEELEGLVAEKGDGKYLALAELCHEAELYKPALEFLNKCPEELPPDYLFLRGLLHWKTRNYALAAKDLGRCREDHPQAKEARLVLLGCRWLMGEASKGEAELAGSGPGDYLFLVRFFLDEADRVLKQAEGDFPEAKVLVDFRSRLDRCRREVQTTQ